MTCGISSGWLRNHGEKTAHHSNPSTATITSGIFQSCIARNIQTRSSGARQPPIRLDIQTAPWAEPRSVVGIQSAIIRAIAGNVPAWNAPNRNRSTTSTATISSSSRGRNPTSARLAVSVDPPTMIAASTVRVPNASASSPQGISKRP